jgi:hypothetical protein
VRCAVVMEEHLRVAGVVMGGRVNLVRLALRRWCPARRHDGGWICRLEAGLKALGRVV